MIRYFAKHPTAANLLMVAILLVGVLALPKLQRDTFPITDPTQVEVRVTYPGATALDVEEAICLRVEEALGVIPDKLELTCEARENLAIGVVTMIEGRDFDTFYNDIKSEIEAITGFPANVERPSVTKMERTATISTIAITGIDDPGGLFAYADKVLSRVMRNKQIAQATLKGFSDPVIDIRVSEAALRDLGMSINDVTSAIKAQSVDLPSGTLETKSGDLVLRYADQRRKPREFANIVVKSSANGGVVRLKDIAALSRAFEFAEDKVTFNGQRAALIEIAKTPKQDTLKVKALIDTILENERSMAPPGVSLNISQDVSPNIVDRLRILSENGLQGLALVFLVMWLFFSLRYSFWVAMGLPVSFLGAIFAMQGLGYTLNTMTMVGLIVSTGLLMDDAIVISENIGARLKKGEDELDAAVKGTLQVLPSVISSFLTTILIVGPLALMAGKIGAVLKVLPVILVITLAISLIEAFLILPSHLYHSLKKQGERKPSRFHAAFDRGFEGFRNGVFGRMIDWAISWRYLTTGLILAMLILSYGAFSSGMLKFRSFPKLESDTIQARILMPQGTPLAETEVAVQQVVAALKKVNDKFKPLQSEQRDLVNNILVYYGVNADSHEKGPHQATISADLIRAQKRKGSLQEMLSSWRKLTGPVPGSLAMKFTDKERGVAGNAIDLRLRGGNLEQIKKAADDLKVFLYGYDGVVDVLDDLRPGKPEYVVKLHDDAGSLGLTGKGVSEELRSIVQGNTGLEVQTGRYGVDVRVRLADGAIDSRGGINAIYVTAADGSKVPLATVADVTESRGYARINRVDGMRTVSVIGAIKPNIVNARELMMEVKSKFAPALKKNYPGVSMAFNGQGKEASTTGSSLRTNFLIGLAFVFILLSFQFKSYVLPIIVLAAIPLGAIGMVLGHLAMGLDISIPSLVGLATLSGVVVNNSILLVSFIHGEMEAGHDPMDATKQAAKARFRAVVMTSMTTIAGLLPLLAESSTQAQFLIPLVNSLAFGLLTATVLSLFLVPSLFAILTDFGYGKPKT
ncbi:efflux RND transporter permease subunit [Cohaesibacter sp. CAU 1516]|uniref:efflux RND transporter permease subunit n=1 Tax=Cohaesibacter sp. CAU 1516 TaxID=2576038 RepID=UPI0010FCE91A|nr:efflux RND transporter permease subunit [Cohaesibacter sp. CAU 1516]TLP44222.1 efflux RND transporter permease subunit [Cohaesibacter sp. CAU 1516]